MNSQANLFYELIEKSEKYLIPLGIWPTASNSWIALLNIIILLGYASLVIIKNVLNPERKSIENAFALANACITIAIYFATLLMKKDKLTNFYGFIKSNKKIFSSNESWKLIAASGIEFSRISKAFLYILATAVVVRFLQPPLEYVYIQIFTDDATFALPPSMGVPTFWFGDTQTYVIESLIRMIVLTLLMGIGTLYVMSTLFICTQCNLLALELENFNGNEDDDETINKLIEDHQEILKYAELLNEIFSPYFFADCFFSYINLTIMMFSLIASNANIQNYMMEIPLIAVGMSQLFFVLYFGDRLIDATFQISTAVYESEWYTKSIKIEKKFLLIMVRAQTPQTLNVGNGILVASMLLFSEICQNAYGAFNILRTTVKR